MNWPVEVFVEFRVIGDEPHPDVVRFWYEKCGAAPIRCVVHWGDDASVDQLLDRFGGFLFIA